MENFQIDYQFKSTNSQFIRGLTFTGFKTLDRIKLTT